MSVFGPPNVDKLKAKNDIEGLLKALTYKKDDKVRSNAAIALGEVGNSLAVKPLINALKDTDESVCASAAESLGWIRSNEAVVPLIIALRDGRIRDSVAIALGNIGNINAVEPLIDILADSRSYVRDDAVIALGKLRDKRALNALRKALKDDDNLVRFHAVDSLINIGGADMLSIIPPESLFEEIVRDLTKDWSPSSKKLYETTWKSYKTIDEDSLIPSLSYGYDEKKGISTCIALGMKGTKRAKEGLIKVFTMTHMISRGIDLVECEMGKDVQWAAYLILKRLGIIIPKSQIDYIRGVAYKRTGDEEWNTWLDHQNISGLLH